MYKELIVKTNSQKYKVFLQKGFYSSTAPAHKLHKHNYPEIHVVTNGSATFTIGENSHTLKSGNLMIVPRGIFHCFDSKDKDTLCAAFQIDCELNEILIYDIGTDTILNFMQESEKAKLSQDYSTVATYVALFSDYFSHNKKLATRPVTDYGFLIHEFFSIHYSEDLHICDLANALHLSERQTERLVIKHTGNSFKKELSAIRMNIAKRLLKSSEMSLKEISQYVGYKSYAGFWKSMKKYDL